MVFLLLSVFFHLFPSVFCACFLRCRFRHRCGTPARCSWRSGGRADVRRHCTVLTLSSFFSASHVAESFLDFFARSRVRTVSQESGARR